MNTFLLSLLACTSDDDIDSAVESTVEPSSEEVPESFEVTGQVVDDDGVPIEASY